MTTVTEAAKRLGDGVAGLDDADLAALRRDPALAHHFARKLAVVAREVAPSASLSVEDLREVLEIAMQNASADPSSRIVEGRYLRKRVREQCAYVERYGDSFALAVFELVPEPKPGQYVRAMAEVVSKLRQSDMVTVYRRRVAMLLPRISVVAVASILARVRSELDRTSGRDVVQGAQHLVYPSASVTDTQGALDWLEDRLRVDL